MHSEEELRDAAGKLDNAYKAQYCVLNDAITELVQLRQEKATLKQQLAGAQAEAAGLRQTAEMLLELIDHEAPPNFGANGNVAPDGSDEGAVMTWMYIEYCRKNLGGTAGKAMLERVRKLGDVELVSPYQRRMVGGNGVIV